MGQKTVLSVKRAMDEIVQAERHPSSMESKKVIKIGFLGLGTVGQGVWKHIDRNSDRLKRRVGAELQLHRAAVRDIGKVRSEEHTSELQSRGHLVCRLLLENKTAQVPCISVTCTID